MTGAKGLINLFLLVLPFLFVCGVSVVRAADISPVKANGDVNFDYRIKLHDLTAYDPDSVDKKAAKDSLKHQTIIVVYYGQDLDIRDKVRQGTSWVRDKDKNPIVPFMLHTEGNNGIAIYAYGKVYLIPKAAMESAIDLITAENVERIYKEHIKQQASIN